MPQQRYVRFRTENYQRHIQAYSAHGIEVNQVYPVFEGDNNPGRPYAIMIVNHACTADFGNCRDGRYRHTWQCGRWPDYEYCNADGTTTNLNPDTGLPFPAPPTCRHICWPHCMCEAQNA